MVADGTTREDAEGRLLADRARYWHWVRLAAVACALLGLVAIKLLRPEATTLFATIGLVVVCLSVGVISHVHRHLLLEFVDQRRMNHAFRHNVERLLDDMAVSLRSAPGSDSLARALLEARRVELLPHVAASLAHDANNLLSVVQGATEMVAYALPKDHPAHEDLGAVRAAAAQLTNLNRQLIAWSRPLCTAPADQGPFATLRELEPALKRLVGRKIELTLDLQEDAAATALSPQDFSQIAIQLLLNAKEAISATGKIQIAVTNEGDGTVLLRVEDNGNGIAGPLSSRVFEPFFTTKSERSSLGLGLSSVRALVESVGGHIELRPSSLFPTGTLVSVHLPSSKDTVMTANASSSRFPNGSAPNLLVLDDEDTVRHLLVRMLTRDGYNITEAATLPEALTKASLAERLDVWVTDANVDGTDATTGVAAMRELHPNIAIVLISGREPEADRMEVLKAEGVCFLAKPFVPAELRAAIDEAYRHGSATSTVVPLPQDVSQKTGQQAR